MWGVEPDIRSRCQKAGHLHVIVLEVDDRHVIAECLARPEHMLDDALAFFVVRMRLAGVDDLQAAGRAGDRAEAIGVEHEQISAFVRRCATTKADRQDRRIKRRRLMTVDELEQLQFGGHVGIPYL